MHSTRFMSFYKATILRYPLLTALIALALVLWASVGIRHVAVDASADALVLQGDKSLEIYRDMIKRYNTPDYLFASYEPLHNDLYDEATLADLEQLEMQLLDVEGVETVNTIRNVPLLYSPPVTLATLDTGIRYLSEPGIDKSLVAAEFLRSPVYKNLLTSTDARFTAVQINLKRDDYFYQLLDEQQSWLKIREQRDFSEEERQQVLTFMKASRTYALEKNDREAKMVSRVRAILDQHQNFAQIHLGGVPMIATDMVSFIKNDLATFGAGILLFIIALLAVIFRRLRWVVLPLLTCVSTAAMLLGLLGWVDWRLTVISSNFIALLLILTLSISIHLVVRYRELVIEMPQASNLSLVTETIRFMAKPCLFTTLTTIVAFLSLVVSGIKPVIDFGWMMTFGCIGALLMAFTLLPAAMLLFKREHIDNAPQQQHEPLTVKFAEITENFGRTILVVCILLFALSAVGVSQLKVENSFIDYFDESTEINKGMLLIDQKLGGTIPLDILIRKPKPELLAAATKLEDDVEIDADDNFFGDEVDDFAAENSADVSYWFTTSGMSELAKIHHFLDGREETGKVMSLVTLYELMNDVSGGGIDDIQLALLENTEIPEIENNLIQPFIDRKLDEAHINLRVMETSPNLQRQAFIEDVHRFMQEDMGYSRDQYELTGMLVLYNNMLQSLFKSQISTLGAVFVAILIMFTLLFRSFVIAIIAITPNVLAALMVLGGMGLVGIPLDMMTITIAAIAIGIGVDDTIHYIHRFRKEFAREPNYIGAMYRSHASIGKAMYYTSVTIIAGFSILAFSNFKPSLYFGLLTGLAMLSALLGSLLLLPKLLLLFKPMGPEGGRE